MHLWGLGRAIERKYSRFLNGEGPAALMQESFELATYDTNAKLRQFLSHHGILYAHTDR